ncbi:MAG: hypothetical protein AAGC85_08490 [Bacteroidota bacterium]
MTDPEPLGDPIRISEKRTGEMFSFLLDSNQLGAYTGWINVQITYKKWNQDEIYKKTYYLYHPGWFK